MPSNRVLLGLSLGHHRIVLAGAGKVATRRVQLLLDSGALSVTVVAPWASEVISELAAAGRITYKEQEIRRDDLIDATMVIIATNDALANSQVAGWAEDLGVPLVNHAGHHEQGNTIFPPNWKSDPWQFAVHGGDGGPVFALWALAQFDHLVREQGFTLLSEVAAEVRRVAYEAGRGQSDISKLIQNVLNDEGVREAARRGSREEALARAREMAGLA